MYWHALIGLKGRKKRLWLLGQAAVKPPTFKHVRLGSYRIRYSSYYLLALLYLVAFTVPPMIVGLNFLTDKPHFESATLFVTVGLCKQARSGLHNGAGVSRPSLGNKHSLHSRTRSHKGNQKAQLGNYQTTGIP